MNKDQMILKELVRKKTQYIKMGLFPQTIKDESVKIISEENGYYLGSDNEKYIKAKANPYKQNYTFSNGDKVVKDNEYYFKVEPIIWKILYEKNGETLLMSEFILNSQQFDEVSNVFEESKLCLYLNNEFVNNLENDRIIKKQNTKVFILSQEDLQKYIFSYQKDFDYRRTAEVTDYALANYTYMSKQNRNGWYYLKTKTENKIKSLYYVSSFGSITRGFDNNIQKNEIGFIPAIWVK